MPSNDFWRTQGYQSPRKLRHKIFLHGTGSAEIWKEYSIWSCLNAEVRMHMQST